MQPQSIGGIVSSWVEKNPNEVDVDYGNFNTWFLPAMPETDAIDLAIALSQLRKFRTEDPRRVRSRFLVTTWLLNDRKP